MNRINSVVKITAYYTLYPEGEEIAKVWLAKSSMNIFVENGAITIGNNKFVGFDRGEAASTSVAIIQPEHFHVCAASEYETTVYNKVLSAEYINGLIDRTTTLGTQLFDKWIPQEVKDAVATAPELAEHVKAKLSDELAKLVDRMSGGK